MVDGKWSRVSIALSKGRVPMMIVMMWCDMVMRSMVGVVDCWNTREEPCSDGEDAVPEDVGSGYLLMTGKWVVWGVRNSWNK